MNETGLRHARALRLVASFSAAVSLTFVAPAANAEGLDLDPYAAPAPGSSFFFPSSTRVGPNLHPSTALTLDAAYAPLTLYTVQSQDRIARVHEVVSFETVAHARASLPLVGRLRLDLSLPFQLALIGSGDSRAPSVPAPQGNALGDVRAGLSVRLFGTTSSTVQGNVELHVRLPTGSPEAYDGESSVRWEPGLSLAGEYHSWAWGLSARGLFRKQRQISTTALSHEAYAAAAVGLRSRDGTLTVGPELLGHVVIAGPGAGNETSTGLEALLGTHKRWESWKLGLAAGLGLARGIGTPAARLLIDLTYDPPTRDANQVDTDRDGILDTDDACPKTPGRPSSSPRTNGCPPETTPTSDRDGDGVLDSDDACPETPGKRSCNPKRNGCPDTVDDDRDGDGIPNAQDACPTVPGERSCDPKRNGCPTNPSKDRDGDGIVDDEDACPTVPGERSCDPKRNGCPLLTDADRDGVLDSDDACPTIAGLPTNDPRTNGCPPSKDKDRDSDGIPDSSDACPTLPGPASKTPTQNGCPKLVKLTKDKFEIFERVYFETAKARILPVSDPLLEQVARVLKQHPEITKVRVEGHTDSRAGWLYNLRLSQRRAESVVNWLVTRGGIDPSRLIPRGYGPERPVASNATAEGRQKNRRVEFRILERKPTNSPTDGPNTNRGEPR